MATERTQFAGEQATNSTAGSASNYVQQLTDSIVSAAPNILGAIAILLIGWILGKFFGGIVSRIVDRLEIDRGLQRTPVGRMMGGTEREVARTMGKIAKWFIYALAILAAADVLAISLLSRWISQAVSYLPSFIGGLLVILLGFILADFIADIMERTEATTGVNYTEVFANAVRIFLYFIVIVIGLETMGVAVGILYIFARALSWGIALGIGLAIAIAFGWGGKDYVRDNMDRWTTEARERSRR